MSDYESDQSVDSAKEYVVKNTTKSQEAKLEAKRLKEEERKKTRRRPEEVRPENLKKAHEKRAELKPVNAERMKATQELKTLKRIAEAKEAMAQVEALKKRIAELDVSINESRAVQEKARTARAKPEALPPVAVVEQPKQRRTKVRNIVVREERDESDNDSVLEESIEVIKPRPRGRPRIDAPPRQEPVSSTMTQAPPKQDIKKMALKEAIDKQTNQLLYNSLFGY